jgi:DNA repair protein RadC
MALIDCMKKLGKDLSSDDRELLQVWIDQGLTDEQVLQRYDLHIKKTLVDITKRAQDKGAKVSVKRDVLAEVSSFSKAKLFKARVRLAEVRTEHQRLNELIDDILWVETNVQHWPEGGPPIDLNDPGQIGMRIQQMLFRNKAAFTSGRFGDGQIKGKDAFELTESFLEMQARGAQYHSERFDAFSEEVDLVNEIEDLQAEVKSTLDENGNYRTGMSKPDPVRELDDIKYGSRPWKISRGKDAVGDLYITRHGARAGTPHKTRQGPNDFAITLDANVLLSDYTYYLLMYLQPQVAARAHGSVQQHVSIRDLDEILVNHFRNQVREDTGATYTAAGISQEKQTTEALANYKAIVKVEEQGTLSTGITKVASAADVAHVLASIRKNASEGFWALVLDKDNNVVGVVEHTRGGIDGTSVYPSIFAGAVHTIPGAAKIWMAHNHPSGGISPSMADASITKRISKLLDGSDVEVMGHVLLGGGSDQFTLIDKDGGTVTSEKIKAYPRRKKVSIYTRKIAGKQEGPLITSPADTEKILKDMGHPDGILLLNVRHRVLGFLSMTPDEMHRLKNTGQSSRIIRAMSEMNAAAFIVSTNSEQVNAANNMASFANATDWRMLDAVYLENGSPVSMASEGRAGGGDTFYQQSNIGFTSGLLTAVQTMSREKGTVAEMLGALRKTKKNKKGYMVTTYAPGVTKAEMDWLDVEDWAAAKGGTITRQEMIDYIRANGIVVEEVQATGDDAYRGEALENGTNPRDILLKMPEVPQDSIIYNFDIVSHEVGGFLTDDLADDLITFVNTDARMAGAVLSREGGDYTRDGQGDKVTMTAENITEDQYDLLVDELGLLDLIADNEQVTDFRTTEPQTGPGLQQNFGFSHFNQKNILAWIRTTERVGPSGERILMVEEVQSDWHQQGKLLGYREAGVKPPPSYTLEETETHWLAKDEDGNALTYPSEKMLAFARLDKRGYRTEAEARQFIDRTMKQRHEILIEQHVEKLPDAPFKGRGWPKLAMKRIIRLAAEEGYDQIAWTTGETQNERASQNADDEKMLNFYDEELVNLTNEAARKLDKSASVKKFGQTIQTRQGAPFTHALKRATGLRSQSGVGWYVVDYQGRKVKGPFEEESMARGVAEQDNATTTTVHSLEITDQMRAAALEGQTLFQNKKGSITFDQARRGIIKLTESRDLSTFMHEASHLYLEILGSMVDDGNAPQQVIDDYNKILEYIGAKDRASITREQHEFWAESFEKYMQEGKAPSVALQSAFNAFRRWLTEIWKRMLGDSPDGIILTPEIRSVMDRILASDEQIAEANAQQEFGAVFSTAEQMGVSQRVFDVYKQNFIKANNEAIEKETARLMEAANREARVWWRDEKAKVQAEVEDEAFEKHIYKSFWLLAKGTKPDGSPTDTAPFKIDKASLLELLQGDKDSLARLPKPWVYAVKGGVDVDVAARALGYRDGHELVKALMEMPNMKDWIAVTTDERMAAKFPDPLLDGSVSEEAVKAVHSDRRASILAAEMRELRILAARDRKIVSATKQDAKAQARDSRLANKGTLPKRDEIALIRRAARETMAEKRVMDVQPQVYLNAERRAGRLAFEAAARGDFEKAYLFKRQQVVNHEMYRAAVKAKEQSLKTRNYLAKFSKPKVQQRLGKLGVLDPILAILEGIELKKVTLKEINRRSALQSLAQQIHDGAIVTPVSEFLYHVEHDSKGNEVVVLNEAPFKNWQELTVGDLAALQDIIKQLEHQAKRKLEMPVNGEMVVLDDAIEELTQQVLEVHEIVDIGVGEKTRVGRAKQAKASGIAHWLGPSVMGAILDKQGWGATTRLIIVNIRRAIAEKLIPMQMKAINDVSKIFLQFYAEGTLNWRTKALRRLPQKGYATINGESLSKSDVLSIALNMGNEGNKEAIFNGVRIDGKIAYPEAEVNAALAKLDANDWAFVQAIWDYLDTYWEQLAAMEKERRGIAPERVEHVPFTVQTSDGQTINMRGGYMPLKYNYEHSERHEEAIFEDHYKKMGNGVYLSANTRAGATHNRVKNHNMVVQLGLHNIERHLKEITRDIAIGDEVNFAKNLLNDKGYRKAMKQTGNATALRELNLWLTDAAVGELPANNMVERGLAYTRVGFTMSKLAFNVYTTVLQLTGIMQSMVSLGKRAMAMGAGRVMRNPVSAWRESFEASAFLRARYGWKSQAFDVAINDAASVLSEYGPGLPTTTSRIRRTAARTFFLPIAKMQQMVDVITWWGAIWKARNDLGLGEQEAVHYADAQVELGQTSGFFSDRSGIERGTLSATTRQNQFIRLWTTLISYMQRKGNIAYMKTQDVKENLSFATATMYALDMLLLFTAEGIASAMIYGRWDWEEDDPEALMINALKETGLSVMAGIPFVREFPAAQYGSGNTPIGTLTNDLFKLYTQALQGEMDPALRKAFVNSFGTLFHLPASQTNRLLEALIDEDDPELLEYFTGTRD